MLKFGRLEEGLINILKKYKGNYAIQSFNPFSIYWFKRKYPEIVRGQLSKSFEKDKMFIIKKFFLKSMFMNFFTKPKFISYDINSLPNKKIEKYRNSGVLILGWTVRDEKNYENGIKYCDNLICENFEKLLYKSKIIAK